MIEEKSLSPALMPSNTATFTPLLSRVFLTAVAMPTVLLFVVQNSNDFRFDVIRDVVTRGRALGAVQSDRTEDHFVTTGGDVRAGGSRGDHDHAFVFVNVGRGLSGAGAQVTDHKLDAVVDDFVRDRYRLFRITGIVVFNGFELLAVDTALGVDVFDGHFGATELHIAVLGYRAGFRAGDTDLDGVSCERMAGNPGQNHSGKQFGNLLSSLSHRDRKS